MVNHKTKDFIWTNQEYLKVNSTLDYQNPQELSPSQLVVLVRFSCDLVNRIWRLEAKKRKVLPLSLETRYLLVVTALEKLS